MKTILTGEDGKDRCNWHRELKMYRRYHDEEWGRPVADDFKLFEKICLEGFQSGLSWLVVLKKRENFREVFLNFDFNKVAYFNDDNVMELMQNAGIIRHHGKIVSTINNARRAIELCQEFGTLANYVWSFEPPRSERPDVLTYKWLKENPSTPASKRLSKDLKKRGWTYVGPIVMYAFMQAMGMVNDHLKRCYCREEVEQLRNEFIRPQYRG